MKPIIAFVDDDAHVLRSMKRMLFQKAREWDMRFVSNGPDALYILGTEKVDVLVADLRMPGMDGLELLGLARETSPGTTRLVLSGYAEQAVVRKVVPLVHQFISKPCEQEELVEAISRTLELRSCLEGEALRALVGRIDSLPAIPDVYERIMVEMSLDEPDLGHVARILESDPGLSANILKLVNSSFFGFSREIISIGQAVNLLGLDILRSFVLTSHLFSRFQSRKFSLAMLQGHCLRTARLAQRIAESENLDQDMADASLVAGLLHDVGKIVLVGTLPEDYAGVLEMVRGENRGVAEAEEAVFGASHAKVGAYVMGLWGLPGAVIEAIALHHEPAEPGERFTPLSAVRIANILDHHQCVINTDYNRPEAEAVFLGRQETSEKFRMWKDFAFDVAEDACRPESGPVTDADGD